MATQTARREPGWIPDLSTFGARLAAVRQAMGWGNVAEAATACGIPVATWRNWERDGREPRGIVTKSMMIAGVTGVDYRWLAMGPERMPEPASPGMATRRYQSGPRVVATIAPNARSIVRTQPVRDRSDVFAYNM